VSSNTIILRKATALKVLLNQILLNVLRVERIDLIKIKSLLRNAWFTETQLNHSREYPEFIPYANHWACVQVYYAVYSNMRALFTAVNPQIGGAHALNLKEISQLIVNRRAMFPYPLSVTCSGDPESKDSIAYNNLPANVGISQISALKSNPKFWDSYCLFLKTTRRRQIEDKRKDPPYSKQKRISKIVKSEIVNSIPPTTLFDCLFRLRVRANYDDIDSFIIAVDDKDSAYKFHSSLINIGYHTMQATELLILRYIGKNNFVALVSEFKRDVKYDAAVCARLELLLKLIE
jgi:hypothetical protein